MGIVKGGAVMQSDFDRGDDVLPPENRISSPDAEVAESKEGSEVTVSLMMNGWEVRDGATPTPAIKQVALRVHEHSVRMNLPEFVDEVSFNAQGYFFFQENNGHGNVTITGRIRGQFLIVNAERKQGEGDHSELRLSAVLPFALFGGDPEYFERVMT
jgi:hypothetical protein